MFLQSPSGVMSPSCIISYGSIADGISPPARIKEAQESAKITEIPSEVCDKSTDSADIKMLMSARAITAAPTLSALM